MIVTLLKKDRISYTYLPMQIKGQFWFKDHDLKGEPRNLFSIEANAGKWFIRSNKNVSIFGTDNKEIRYDELLANFFYRIKLDNEIALLFAEALDNNRLKYRKYFLNMESGTNITIGRNADNVIQYGNNFVSGYHSTLMFYGGHWSIQDNHSQNGTFVNNLSVESKKLNPGDVINILSLSIIIGDNFIAINNPANSIKIDKKVFRAYIEQEFSLEERDNINTYEIEYFYPSPRFKRDIEKTVIRIDPPTQNQLGDSLPMILVIGPSITMGMASASMGVFAVTNAIARNDIRSAMPSIVMSLSMLLGTILWPIISRRYEKRRKLKREQKRQEKYSEYLSDMDKKIEEECQIQGDILHENFITVDECKNRISEKKITLWERNSNQNDFLLLRVGIGNSNLNAEISYPEKRFSIDEDNLEEELYKLAKKPKILKDVPISISLFKSYITSIIGDRKKCIDFVNGLILQIVSLYGYDEVKTVFLFDEIENDNFRFSKWLPHAWNNDKSFRFIGTNINEVKNVSSYIEKEIENRLHNENRDKKSLPYYIIFAFSHELSLRAEMIKQIYSLGKNINISIVCLFNELKNIPKESTSVIELSDKESKIFDINDTSGISTKFTPDIFVNKDIVYKASETLANIHLDLTDQKYQLPNMITFLGLFEAGKVEHLNPLQRWKENDPTKSLKAAIGVNTLGDKFYLDLHEDFHGPHGLIAGMTGSGKSEFIITYILSLALNYHPEEVSFLLIDYKGGGMAKSFEKLPHVAGIMTNLDGLLIKRSFVSIESERDYRQAVFSKATEILGDSNMNIYKYQKAYRDGLVKEPLPHLFIIADEFAELKSQQPDFMNLLTSVARVGRSLGIHLILATQKPAGVVDDQIWSNSRLKICLKVQDRADSMDMLKRPDAAELKNTGRFYMQVGYNELFELGQSAWAGASYIPQDTFDEEDINNISVIDINGRIIQEMKIDNKKKPEKDSKKQLDKITDYIIKTAEDENIRTRLLWLEPIPPMILLEDLRKKYSEIKEKDFILNPLVGEYDDPAHQKRHPLYLPLSEGNAIFYGFAGSGKTTLTTTMIYSLLCEHTTETLNIYILDFGSETLRIFKDAPQVGDVVISSESEKIINLFKMMRDEITARKKLFSDWGGDYKSYCSTSGNYVPNIVIIINNYSALLELYENSEEYISQLSSEGIKYGIHMVLTANSTNAIRYKLLQNFAHLFVLQLNDDSDYAGILGKTDGVLPSKFKGRGLIKYDTVYEFQVAHITEPSNLNNEVKSLCLELSERQDCRRSRKIPILPDKVDTEFFSNMKINERQIPIGVNKNNLNIEYIDIESSLMTVVASIDGNLTGRFMQGLAEIISEKVGINTNVLDVDELFFEDEKRKYKYDLKDLEAKIVELFNLMVERNKKYKIDRATVFEKIVYILPSISELFKILSTDGVDKLNVLLENGKAEFNVHIIISGSISDVQNLSVKKWYKEHCSGNGIWVGDGAADQYQLKISKIPSELRGEIGNEFGVIINNGKCKIIKLLQTHVNEMEEANE